MESLMLCGRRPHLAETILERYASDDPAAQTLALTSERESVGLT
jgi:hypothetical protein